MSQAGLLALIAGLSGGLGQAPFDLWYLAIPGFAALVLLVASAPVVRRAGALALIGGSAYFAVALCWIVEPFFVDAARHGWMAPFAILFLSVGLALFWMAAGWASSRLVGRGGLLRRAMAFAAFLALVEYARATVLTGFPWAHPGHILIDTPLLMGAALIGPHGLTLLVLVLAVVLAVLLARFGMLAALGAAAPIVAVMMLAAFPPGPVTAIDAPVIRLIQPNAPQHLKWRPDMIPVFFERAVTLTAEPPQIAGREPALVIWPETSLPVPLNQSEDWRAVISQAAGPVPVILGAQRLEGVSARNALVVLDASGAIAAVYDKHHLVPFGEYMPFGDALAGLGIRGFATVLQAGYRPGDGPASLDLGDLGQAFAMICYETIFPGYIRQVPRPDWMVQITNDAWFGEFSGPYQHLALARLRAAEQGLPLLRAANTGVSALIDARGQVVRFLPLGEAGVLDVALPPPLPPTFYARSGDWPVLFVILITLAGIVVTGRRDRH
ncbi:apolipoprotein N-acyltransferase [Rhodophyticola sp. CCM32]|nr:apolipoprotein N-acyltransferase [Rhodophyticola sp. CCM32]